MFVADFFLLVRQALQRTVHRPYMQDCLLPFCAAKKRKTADYVPRLNSAPYALLITMYRCVTTYCSEQACLFHVFWLIESAT